jgi:hypothetical protein
VIRTFTGTAGLVDELTKRRGTVEEILRAVPGFIAYYLIKTHDGMASVTVCENKAGTDESSRRAAEWLKANMPQFAGQPPKITEGELAFRFYDKSMKVGN